MTSRNIASCHHEKELRLQMGTMTPRPPTTGPWIDSTAATKKCARDSEAAKATAAYLSAQAAADAVETVMKSAK